MELQINYRCDICEEKILIDFEKSYNEGRLECPNCGVIYDFSADELKNFNRCYQEFLNKMKNANNEQIA